MNSCASAQYDRTLSATPPFYPALGQKRSADELYSLIFDAIVDQRIDSHRRFTEDSLGQMFDAGRSEVRRVLTRLHHEQVIILRPNHRPRVATPTREQTRQILHARRLAETTLVELASQRHSPGDLKTLRDLIEIRCRHLEHGQRAGAIRLCGEFHLQLARIAGNSPLAHFLGSLVPLTSMAIARFAADIESACCSWRHAAIVDAIEQGEVATAVQLTKQYLDALEQSLGCAPQ
ncbi:GntR family transcriptional regulator [Pseudomonas sp. Eth.TT006]